MRDTLRERDYSQFPNREEIAIGAHARAQRRRRILLGIFGVGLALVGLLLYRWITTPDITDPRFGYAVKMYCRECQEYLDTSVPHSRQFPDRCPRCGERALDPVWRCHDCGALFVPGAWEGVRCEQCGSQRVGAAAQP